MQGDVVTIRDSIGREQHPTIINESGLYSLVMSSKLPTARRYKHWVTSNGYLVRRKGADYNMPTQKAMELGLFEVKETAITHADGHISVNRTTKVTGRGQVYFINKFLA